MPDDLGDELRKDYKKFRKLQNMGSGSGLSLTKKMEFTFWAVAVLAAGGMVVAMFFIDPAKHGRLWLFGSLGTIIVFAGLALAVRHLPEV